MLRRPWQLEKVLEHGRHPPSPPSLVRETCFNSSVCLARWPVTHTYRLLSVFLGLGTLKEVREMMPFASFIFLPVWNLNVMATVPAATLCDPEDACYMIMKLEQTDRQRLDPA